MTTSTPPHQLFIAEVTQTQLLAANLIRLTFQSDEFCNYTLTGPDEFFGLLMPQAGQPLPTIDWEGSNIRAAVAALPDKVRPQLRWYTIRKHRPALGEIDVDIVTHGDDGPGSSWVLRAQAGDIVGIFTCASLWAATAHTQLLIADASAIPAMRHILEKMAQATPERLATTSVIAFAPSSDYYESGLELWAPQVARFELIECDPTLQADKATTLMKSWFADPGSVGTIETAFPENVWVSGERELTKVVRKYAVKHWQLPSEKVTWVPYWILGQARP